MTSKTIFEHMRGKNIKAALFDMDGTLFDSEIGSIKMMKELIFEQRGAKSDLDFEELTGLAYPDKMTALLGYEDKELIEMAMKRGGSMYAKIAEPLDGVNDCLSQLAKNGFRMAICTNGYMELLRPVFDKLSVTMDLYQGCDEGLKRKPAPDLFDAAIKYFNLTPQEVFVVEDSHIGVKAALAAGVPEENILIFDPLNLHEDSEQKFTSWIEMGKDERAELRK